MTRTVPIHKIILDDRRFYPRRETVNIRLFEASFAADTIDFIGKGLKYTG